MNTLTINCCGAPLWQDVTSRIIAEDAPPPYDLCAGTEGAYIEEAVEVTTHIHCVWRCESCRAVYASPRRVQISHAKTYTSIINGRRFTKLVDDE